MAVAKTIYKVLRSIVFTAAITVVGSIVLLYLILSLPPVQEAIKDKAVAELKTLLNTEVKIGKIEYSPFNELRLNDVEVYDRAGKHCASAKTLAAGIGLWKLITDQKIEITYAEVIGLNLAITKNNPGEPLNIQFILDSFKSKNEKKSQVIITLRNIVIRQSQVTYNNLWIPVKSPEIFDINHIALSNIRADLEIPNINGDDISVDLRRLALSERSGLNIDKLSFKGKFSPELIHITDFILDTGNSDIRLSDINLPISGYNSILSNLKESHHNLRITANPLLVSEFAGFYQPLNYLNTPLDFSAEISGNFSDLDIKKIVLREIRGSDNLLMLKGRVESIDDFKRLKADVTELNLNLSERYLAAVGQMTSNLPSAVNKIITELHHLQVNFKGFADLLSSSAAGEIELESGVGNLTGNTQMNWTQKGIPTLYGINIQSENLNLGKILGHTEYGNLTASVEGDVTINGVNSDGHLSVDISSFEWKSKNINGIEAEVEKNGPKMSGHVTIEDDEATADLNMNAELRKGSNLFHIDSKIEKFNPFAFGLKIPGNINSLKTSVTADLMGSNPEDFCGTIRIRDLDLKGKNQIHINNLELTADAVEKSRYYKLDSDLLVGSLTGNFTLSALADVAKYNLYKALPSIFHAPNQMRWNEHQYADIDLSIIPNESVYSALGVNIQPGTVAVISGHIADDPGNIELNIDAPYLIKGKDKLIKNTGINLTSSSGKLKINGATDFPIKNGRCQFKIDGSVGSDSIKIIPSWQGLTDPSNHGAIDLAARIYRSHFGNQIFLNAMVNPSSFTLAGNEWSVSSAAIDYDDNKLSLTPLLISNGPQYLKISGSASKNPMDILEVNLMDIDLEYIFNILNINYVDFGGRATGRALASQIFGSEPKLRTDGLKVRNLAYNNTVFGDAELESHWDPVTKFVAINADIVKNEESGVSVRGGIFINRDSLSFDFGARKVNAHFLNPFVSGFTSSIEGIATGEVKLAGTFSEIDLTGWAKAEPITIKVDHTNVSYKTNDSIFFKPGQIILPDLKVYDRFGNSGIFGGIVNHEYLKETTFDFHIKNADHLLVFDTNRSINPNWYGQVFASGNGTLRGRPGEILLDLKMRALKPSEFTIALDETQTAIEYTFLTFTDKRKEEMLKLQEIQEKSFEDEFVARNSIINSETPEIFSMDLAIDVDPGVTINLIMDPKAGDKITAHGQGGFQTHYDTQTDEFNIYGKYTLDNGFYNFSLQELIRKNFLIREGSSIAFNGNPLNGILDISAAYRTNANLADLDASFSSDPDLKRTVIPVDAILNIKGAIDAPEISFDLELPTANNEIERKLRSIVSTEDMLNRQVIYLLALNRFYTPEYTSGTQGSEIASAASSTLSAQVQNLVSSITDKVLVSPSFKSDKSDLSDLEVDVALSSSLFDNRLLLNGNIGYRDKSTSQTTFIGDFDLEYLLSKDGKLRLKAYNHFNDASYYLKSALTTQGIGIVYRKDFNDPLSFLRRSNNRKKKTKENESPQHSEHKN
ncbi:MAG: translocation/assembly module TamB [Muribaculaceae bacterium]|nr:translocation/assembly module TamB [Muribaculaceae bacterium]